MHVSAVSLSLKRLSRRAYQLRLMAGCSTCCFVNHVLAAQLCWQTSRAAVQGAVVGHERGDQPAAAAGRHHAHRAHVAGAGNVLSVAATTYCCKDCRPELCRPTTVLMCGVAGHHAHSACLRCSISAEPGFTLSVQAHLPQQTGDDAYFSFVTLPEMEALV